MCGVVRTAGHPSSPFHQLRIPPLSPLQHPHKALIAQRLLQFLQVYLIMQVASQEVDQAGFQQFFRGALDGGAVVPPQGEHIELQLTAPLLEGAVRLDIPLVEAVAFRVGEYGRKAFGLEAEEQVVQVGRLGDKAHLHQQQLPGEGQQFALVHLRFEVFVQQVFRRYFQFYPDAGFGHGPLHHFVSFQYRFFGIRVEVTHHVRGGDELPEAQLLHPADESKGFVHIVGPVVDARQEVGMHIGYQRGEVAQWFGGGAFFEEVEKVQIFGLALWQFSAPAALQRGCLGV